MTDSLMNMLHFTLEDLVENRHGTLSKAQRAHIDAQNSGCARWSMLLLVVAGLGVPVTLGLKVATGENVFLIGTAVCGLVGVLAIALLVFTGQKTTYTLHTVRGKARMTAERHQQPGQPVNKYSHSYTLVIDDVKFNLSKAVYEQLQPDADYAVYYVGEGYTHMVAIEKI